MAEIWLISDTHFGHSNILTFKDKNGDPVRDFSSVDEMDETMIMNWNTLVTPQDKVYHLGDVYFGSGERANNILSRLNGKKRLIVGNHDDLKSNILHKHFQKISMWRKWSELGLLLTHVPVHISTLSENSFNGKQMVNVHGHIHQNQSPEGPYKCVCVEHTNYMPVNIESLRV